MEYTPTTDQVRAVFTAAPGHHTHAGSRHEAFERWLASITAPTPTDDEREALAEIIDKAPATPALGQKAVDFWGDVADAVLAAGFRRSEPQGEPSDVQVDAAITVHRDFPGDHIDRSSAEWNRDRMRAALRAAWGVR